mgnify:FL=1
MEKIKKNKKFLFLTILILIAIVGSFFVYGKNYDFSITNKIKEVNADTCKQLSDGQNHCCSNAPREIESYNKYKTRYCTKGTKNYSQILCKKYTEKVDVVKKFECTSCKTVPAGYSGWVYSNGQCVKGRYLGACGDGADSHNSFSNGNILGYSGGHPITRVEVSGHVAFCIQPEVWYSKCGSYSTSGASVSVNDNIAKIVWAFNHSNKSDEAYKAAQSMIWGTEIIGDADEIYRNMPNNSSSSETHSVSLDKHEITVNLNDTVTVNDKNGTLGNYADQFNITTAGGGVSANRSGNSINITADSIYPLTKTVSVNTTGTNPVVSGTDGNISYTKYSSNSSQDFVAFASGTLGSINFKYYNGDTVTLKLATGSLEIRKIDSFNRPVTAGTKFKIYFENNQEFALEDGTNEFSVDDNGYLLINNLPTGGKLADGTPIGKYIVREVSTTGAYQLNGNSYEVTIKQDTTSTLTVKNDNVLHNGGVTVVKHDEWGRRIEAGTTFKVYYATTDCNGVNETGTLNGTTYCKKEVFTKLGETDTTYTIGEDGTLIINNELPVGGQFADHTPIGTYILQEQRPSSAYELNSSLFVFNASNPSEAITIDVEDKNVKGNLKITKIDSFDRPSTEGVSFTLAYAQKDADGNWIDYQDFVSLEDFKAGKTEATVFTTNKDGVIEIKNMLPVGGKFPNTNVEIGNYILHEVGTTNAYILNTEGMFVPIEANKTAEITVRNENVLHQGGVNLLKHDEWNRSIQGGTTFKVYYATTDCDGAVETGTLDGVTYCKKAPFVNLQDKKEGKTESIYTVKDDGTLMINNELPIGGHFADYTPVGTYIIQEFEPSNAYELNPTLFVFNASNPNETISIDIEDKNVKGNLKINKLDEWGRKTGEGIKFTLAYAQTDGNDNWIDYQDFISVEDYKAGKTEATVFTTNEEGILEINDILPVGGTFPNTDIKIGNYILHEVGTTNAYVLNEEGMFVPLEGHKTAEGDYSNDLRTVSFNIFKQDEEENYRKLNEAEFEVYDISDVLDLNMKYDTVEDCTAHNGVWNKKDNTCSYKTQTITYTKIGKSLDMETILKLIYPESETIIDGKPIKFELSQPSLAAITPFGKLKTNKIGNLTVKVLGGGYELYVDDGDAKIYDDENFNPYNITFYYKGVGNTYYQMDTKSVEITNEEMPDFTKAGEYELSYKVTSSRNVVYEFTRKITVIKDNRHLCLDSGTVDVNGEKIYRYLDTKDICPKEEAVEIIPSHKKETVPVIVTNKDIDETWIDKELYTLDLKIVQDDDTIITTDSEIKELLPIFKGKTGHSYFQVVNRKNHNLYVSQNEMLLYSDEELTTPVLKYIGDSEFGVYDLDSSCWETYKIKTDKEDEKEEIKPDEPVETPTEAKYYYRDYDNKPVEVKLDIKQEKGKLNIPNLKHSRTYLLSETGLPEGYDFSENTNSVYIFDTYDYEIDEVEHSTDINNRLRRIDMILTKTNSNKTVKLDGALFDVYETFEEGLDMNIIDKTKDNFELGILEDGREYFKEALGEVNKDGTCGQNAIAFDLDGNLIDVSKAKYKLYEDDTLYGIDNPLEITLYRLVEGKYQEIDKDSLSKLTEYQENKFSVNEYNQNNPEAQLYIREAFTGTCHKLYTPNTVSRKYLGRYITGGIYEAYVYDSEGKVKLLNNTNGNLVVEYDKYLEGEVEIAIDKDFKNIVKTIKLNNGILETTLSDGTYYTRLKQPTRLVDVETETPDTDTNTETKENEAVAVKKEELIPYDELDPQYQVINKYYVQSGKFTLENIKYFHNLEYVEVKAPNGYLIKNQKTSVVPSAPYGTDYMENTVTNDIIPISSKTGVNAFKMWETSRACVSK